MESVREHLYSVGRLASLTIETNFILNFSGAKLKLLSAEFPVNDDNVEP